MSHADGKGVARGADTASSGTMKRLLLVVVGGSALVARRPTTMRAMQPEARALRTRIKTQTKIKRTLVTLGRVALPSMIATGLGFEYYALAREGIKILRRVLLNRRADLHAIDATPARWRGDAGSSPPDGANTAVSSPRNDLVKNYRVHPTHWLISTQDNLSSFIQANWLDANSIKFLSSDEIQFLPSFLTVISLLFSILAGSAYSSLYAQQEAIYFALYAEVSEAKSLLEQMALVCAGRPFYRDALRAMRAYVKQDLRRLDVAPADLMARPPNEDPLEAIMYLTSVGVPSVVYETVRDLRQARGRRLGAMQRKFPRLGIFLLYLLALLELAAFPLLGAGTTISAPSTILLVQGALFGGSAPVWKSTSVSGAHFSVMTRPCWLRRAVRNRHSHAIEQASRRWRGGRRERDVKF